MLPNLEYRTGDATRWADTIGPENFDAIVSFDMIEQVVVRPEDAEFPHRDVFDLLAGGPVVYLLKMNPVVCREPVVVENPYR